MVHERLERGWSIAESKEHNSGFKESERSDERSFPLVLLANSYVVEAPSNIELGEYGGILHIVN